MSAWQNDINVLGGTQIFIGTSQVIRVTCTAGFQFANTFKIGAGGGTLEIVPPQLSGSSTAAGNAWGKGYALGANEVFNIGGPAVMYFAATGATMTLALAIGYTQGASTP